MFNTFKTRLLAGVGLFVGLALLKPTAYSQSLYEKLDANFNNILQSESKESQKAITDGMARMPQRVQLQAKIQLSQGDSRDIVLNEIKKYGQSHIFGSADLAIDDRTDYVDTLLRLDAPKPLTIDGQTWQLRHAQAIRSARPVTNALGDPLMRRETDKSGRTITYMVYESPSVYYVIADLPDNAGRYYGLITCGYDKISTITDNEKSKWHPQTRVEALSGTIVQPDGTRADYLLHSEADWKKNAVTKPAGSFWGLNALGGQKLNITFNPAGTGTITIYGGTKTWTLQLVKGKGIGGQRNSYTGRMKGARSLSGGYPVWMRPIGKRNFKWTKNADGTIMITPTGAGTGSHEEGLAKSDVEQHYETEADRRQHEQQIRTDFKNANDEAREARQEFNDYGKEAADALNPFVIKPIYMKSNEMLVEILDKPVYLTTTKPDEKNPYQLIYCDLDGLKSSTAYRRTFGVQAVYDNFISDAKRAIAVNPEIFGENPVYEISLIDLKEGTCKIEYIKDNQHINGTMTIDRKGRFDTEAYKASAKDASRIVYRKQDVEFLNDQIMANKDDSRRKKIVKDYEKRYKKFLKYNFNFDNPIDEMRCENLYKEFIEDQKKTLEALK